MNSLLFPSLGTVGSFPTNHCPAPLPCARSLQVSPALSQRDIPSQLLTAPPHTLLCPAHLPGLGLLQSLGQQGPAWLPRAAPAEILAGIARRAPHPPELAWAQPPHPGSAGLMGGHQQLRSSAAQPELFTSSLTDSYSSSHCCKLCPFPTAGKER